MGVSGLDIERVGTLDRQRERERFVVMGLERDYGLGVLRGIQE